MSFISLTLNNIPEATKKPKFYRASYLKVIMARQEFIVLAKVNFHRVAWSQVLLRLHKFIFLGLSVHRSKLYNILFIPFLVPFPLRPIVWITRCLTIFLEWLVWKFLSYSPVLHNGHVCSQKKCSWIGQYFMDNVVQNVCIFADR